MEEPRWPNVHYPPIDYQDIIYYSAPKPKKAAREPGRGRPRAARDLREARHLRSPSRSAWPAWRWTRSSTRVSVATTFKDKLAELGIIFCSFSEAVQRPPRAGAQVPRLGGALHATTSSPRSTRRSSPTARSATSPRACAARWSCPPTSASTPRTPASSSAP